MTEPSLEELAAKGRADRDADEAHQARRREQQEQIALSMAQAASRLSTTPLSFITQYLVGMATWGLSGLGLTAAALQYGWSKWMPHIGPMDSVSVTILLTVILIPLSLIALEQGVARLHAQTTFRPVLDWAESIPFRLGGFDEMLAGGDSSFGEVTVTWVEPLAGESRFALDALTGAGYLVRLQGDSELEIKGGLEIPVPSWLGIPFNGGSNYPYLCWLRKLVDGMLIPLHQRRELAGIAIRTRVGRWGH